MELGLGRGMVVVSGGGTYCDPSGGRGSRKRNRGKTGQRSTIGESSRSSRIERRCNRPLLAGG